MSNQRNPWFVPRAERDEEIRELWIRWYALPPWARHGLAAFVGTVIACLYIAVVIVACIISNALLGDIGVGVALIVGIAGAVGGMVAGISYLDVDSVEARKLRERRTGQQP